MRPSVYPIAVALCITALSLAVGCEETVDRFDGETEHAGTIDTAETWEGTHRITGNLAIEAPVTIERCSDVLIDPGVRIEVRNGGAVIAEGASDCRVTFSSGQDSPSAGDWSRFNIRSSADNSVSFTHTVIEHGGSDPEFGMMWVQSGARLALTDVTFRASEGRALYFNPGVDIAAFENIRLEDLGRQSIYIGPNDVGSLRAVDTSGSVPPVEVRNGVVDDGQTWRNLGLPYEITGNVAFEATVEVEAGTELQMGPGVRHEVRNGGSVRLFGDEDNPIDVRSSKDSPSAGDWSRFNIRDSAGNDVLFRHARIRHGGAQPQFGAAWVPEGATLTLESVVFEDNNGCDIYDRGDVVATDTAYVSCLEDE